MKFIQRVCIGLLLTNNFISLPLLATQALLEDSSVIEDTLSAEEKKERKELGKKAREEVKLDKLDRLLYCATALIEYQFAGNNSAFEGIRYIDRVTKRIKRKEYSYSDLTRSCQIRLRTFKKDYKRKRTTQGLMSDQTRDNYLFKIKEHYPYSRNLIAIAEKALNEKMTCRTAFGFDLKVGVIASFSLGWNHYRCHTPLGRRYHVTGPNAGIGIGFGAIAEVSIAERTDFTTLLNSRNYKIMKDDAQAWAVLVGKGQTMNNTEEKSSDVTLGFGIHTMQRGHFLVKIKRSPNFDKSGLYDLIGVPKEAMY